MALLTQQQIEAACLAEEVIGLDELERHAEEYKRKQQAQQAIKDIKFPGSIVVVGRLWFDSKNGNTYHTASVWADMKFIGKTKVEYGYGEQYLQSAQELLVAEKLWPEGVNLWWSECGRYGVQYIFTSCDVARKKDL